MPVTNIKIQIIEEEVSPGNFVVRQTFHCESEIKNPDHLTKAIITAHHEMHKQIESRLALGSKKIKSH